MNMNIKSLLLCLFLPVILTGCVQKKISSKPSQKDLPNIIYILADDLGYGDLGSYGQTKTKTPRLDQMAAEGLRFTQHYAGSTVCMPSRASLLTGKHQGHASVRGNPRWTITGQAIDLGPTDVTVAKELKRAGYTTGIIGKWGLAEASDEGMPSQQGFDYFYGYRTHINAHHYYPETLWLNDTKIQLEGNIMMEKKGQYAHDLLTEKAIQFVKKHEEHPFFLYLAFTIPHYELTVPQDSKAPYLNLGWKERPMKMAHYRHDAEGHTTYAGMVSRMDRDVGRLLDLLKELNIDEETLVIFTSDNGHEFDRNFFNSNGPLRGKKRDLYEGGIRVPMIARWPGKVKARTQTDHISAFWDFLPTVCELSGLEPTDNIDGISYLPTLLGNNSRQQKHDYLYWEFNEGKGPIQAVRQGDWKAVRYYQKPMELYLLSEDLSEEKNVAKDHPQQMELMKKILAGARTEHPGFPLEPRKRK